MPVVFLGFGSNLGDRKGFIETAVSLVNERIGRVLSRSSFYDSEPWGFVSDNAFVNAAASVETSLEPTAVLERIKSIERELGRVKKLSDGYEDRPIDIDILFYDDAVIDLPTLTVPHPLMPMRRFVLEPLTEIAPDFVHPVLKRSVAELLRDMTGDERGRAANEVEVLS